MPTPFLSPEEYDERAHREYDDGKYDAALDTLKEGLEIYPHSVELYIGMAFTRLAREEFVWARHAFERALVLDPEHEDGLVGLGETLLRFGERSTALTLFARARANGCGEDLDLLLTMGRALYREGLYEEARTTFMSAAAVHTSSVEVAAALGYTLHRLGEEEDSLRQLRRALHLDAEHHEARIFLGHVLYDRGEWPAALRELERVPPGEHWDALAVSRLIELKAAVAGVRRGAPELACWETRLGELESGGDALDLLLAELEDGGGNAGGEAEIARARVAVDSRPAHRVRLPDGRTCAGTWLEIVRQIRDAGGGAGESVADFMRRLGTEAAATAGVSLPADDPREFVLAGARAGYWQIEY
jgi:tetratricopeptide (TPR) repeat protein